MTIESKGQMFSCSVKYTALGEVVLESDSPVSLEWDSQERPRQIVNCYVGGLKY